MSWRADTMDLCVMVCACVTSVCVIHVVINDVKGNTASALDDHHQMFRKLPGSTSRAVKDVTRICARESRSDLTVQTRKSLEINAFD